MYLILCIFKIQLRKKCADLLLEKIFMNGLSKNPTNKIKYLQLDLSKNDAIIDYKFLNNTFKMNSLR